MHVLWPMKYVWMPYLPQIFLIPLHKEYKGESAGIFGESFQEHLKHLNLYMATIEPQATSPHWTTSTLWAGRGKTLLEQ